MRSETDGGTTTPSVDTGSALVVLKGDPLATSEKTKPAQRQEDRLRFDRGQESTARSSTRCATTSSSGCRANAPGAQVTGEFDIALNAVGVKLNGTTLGTIASAPMVASAQLQGLYRPIAHDDPDLRLIHAARGVDGRRRTPAAKGDGVKVAIVDTGIDVTHPCFSDAGYPNQQKQGPAALHQQQGHRRQGVQQQGGQQGLDAEDLNGHGTHVAGTVACNEHTDAVVDGVVDALRPVGRRAARAAR